MKAIVIGSINIDRVLEVRKIVKDGETISSSSQKKYLGGKGLNQAIALSNMFENTYFYANVNPNNKFVVDHMKEHIYKKDYIHHLEEQMGEAFIQVNKNGENAIVVSSNSNHMIDILDVTKVLSEFKDGDFIILQNEINNVEDIIDIAKERGMRVVFNPSPITSAVNPSLISKVDYLVLNKAELAEITDIHWTKESIVKFKKEYPSVRLVVTLGEDGVRYIYQDKKSKVHGKEVEVEDTTCAGDTFLGYFIGAVLNKKTITESLEIATKAASICVSTKGASNSIPSKEQVL